MSAPGTRSPLEDLTRDYRTTLLRFLPRRDEAARESAYGLGRRAFAAGISLLDVCRVHHELMLEVLEAAVPEERLSIIDEGRGAAARRPGRLRHDPSERARVLTEGGRLHPDWMTRDRADISRHPSAPACSRAPSLRQTGGIGLGVARHVGPATDSSRVTDGPPGRPPDQGVTLMKLTTRLCAAGATLATTAALGLVPAMSASAAPDRRPDHGHDGSPDRSHPTCEHRARNAHQGPRRARDVQRALHPDRLQQPERHAGCHRRRHRRGHVSDGRRHPGACADGHDHRSERRSRGHCEILTLAWAPCTSTCSASWSTSTMSR